MDEPSRKWGELQQAIRDAEKSGDAKKVKEIAKVRDRIFGDPENYTHRATIKSYSKEKGFGIVALDDGIAVLRADVLRLSFLEDIEAGIVMHVTLTQTAGGQAVSGIKYFEVRTARFDHDNKKAFFKPRPP